MVVAEVKYNEKKRTLKGTGADDVINAPDYGYVAPTEGKNKDKGLTITGGKGNDSIVGTIYNDVIKGGDGNDTITGTLGLDKITGGKGSNLIEYTSVDQLDGDIIYLTKGENLTIDVKGITTNPDDITYTVVGKNLVVNVNGQEFTVKNYGKKDVTGKYGSVRLVYGSGENDYVDLKQSAVVASDVGTFHNDFIDKHTYFSAKNKGLKISGKAGNDSIIGTDYKDTIKGGDGDDTITAGAGNDKLYGEKGYNTFIFSAGDGNDTIYSGKGEDTLEFLAGDIKFQNGVGKHKRDLIITYNHDVDGVAQDSVTIKNYYDKRGNVSSSIKNVSISGVTFDIEELRGLVENGNLVVGSEYTNGTSGDDVIIANDATYEIHAKQGGNDTIYGASGVWGYYLGTGNNTVYVQDKSDSGTAYVFMNSGDDTIYTTETRGNYLYITTSTQVNGGHDTIHWRGGSATLLFYGTDYADIICTRENGSNDLILMYGESNTVTLKDYYKAGNEGMANFKLSSNNEPEIFHSSWPTLAQIIENKNGVKTMISGVTGGDTDDYIIGTDNAETITGGAGNDLINPKGGTDEIHLGEGNDILFAGNDNKTIFADGGNNTINLGTGVNRVTLGTGEDTVITSSTGVNQITFVEGDTGNDTFIDNGATSILKFSDNTYSDLILDATGDNLVIQRGYGENAKYVTLLNTESNNNKILIGSKTSAEGTGQYLFNLNTLTGKSTSTESQTIATGSGNDSIFAGLGNDIINAGTGNNWITLETADSGNNNTYTYTEGAEDTFVLNGYTDLSGLRFLQTNGDLVIAYNGDFANNTLTIEGYNSPYNIKFCTKNGDEYSSPVNLTALMNSSNTIINYTCTEENHTIDASSAVSSVNITGCASVDNITGSSYNDMINGKGGSDIINGGDGDDLYTIDSGDWGSGLTVISDTAGTADTLRINTTSSGINLFFDVTQTGTVTDGNVSYTKGNDLYINSDNGYTYANAKNYTGTKISGYFNGNSIENVYIPNANDWVNAFESRTIDIIAQNVANWLNANGYTSTTDAIAEGKQADLINLYNPIMGTSDALNGTSGDDIIIANDATYEIRAEQGGNDTIYGASGVWGYYLGTGDNTVYVQDRSSSGTAYVFMNSGDDTIYTTETRGNYLYITTSSRVNGGHDTIYWRGGSSGLIFYGTDYADIICTRETGSNDLILMYGENNTVTLKDYYKAGNEGMADIELTSNNEPERFSSSWPTLNEIIAIKGGVGNDVYQVANINSIPHRSLVVNDNGGTDILNIHNDKADVNIMFNIKKDGTFADGEDKLLLGSHNSFNAWVTNGGVVPASYYCVEINDFDSIETINSNGGYYMDTAKLNALKSDVASWLLSANGGAGYEDVATALTSGDDDLATLIAMFNRDTNWNVNS